MTAPAHAVAPVGLSSARPSPTTSALALAPAKSGPVALPVLPSVAAVSIPQSRPSPAATAPDVQAMAAPAVHGGTEPGRLPRAAALPEVPLSAGPSQAPVASDAPTAAAAPTRPATVLASQFTDHTIASGETLSAIAARYGVSVGTIIANNQGLTDYDTIRPGQTLRIPTTNGTLYNVQQGDTLSGISVRYGVSTDQLVKIAANDLQNADTIRPGQTILIPGDVKPPRPPIASSPVLSVPNQPPAPRPVAAATQPPAPRPAVPAPAPKPLTPPPAPPPTPPAAPPPPPAAPAVARFIWPVQGPITQGFGVAELGFGPPHTGLDIGLYGRDGTPIAAAANGTVVFSGGDACCSYGYYVIISHAGGLTTLYGHLSRRAVSVGEAVTQGQTIGYAGNTGYSTGTHLHFEMHQNGALVNPLRFLP